MAESADPTTNRSFILLKVLATLPHGESLQRLKRLDHRYPIFAKHAEELLDLDLIQVRCSTSLIGIYGEDEERIKILVAPRPVRDYVLSIMTSREIDTIVLKAISLYFGENWKSGSASLKKLGGELTSEDGSLLANPHTLVLRLLERLTAKDSLETVKPILNLCFIYSSALLKGKHYRSCVTVCRDVLSLIPDLGLEAQRQSIEMTLAKALRMAGDSVEAQRLFERLLTQKWPHDSKTQLQICYALCLQTLGDEKAITISNEIIAAVPNNSPYAYQARSIILEMEDDIANTTSKLMSLENKARKLGYNTIANNLTLKRASDIDDFVNCSRALRTVYSTSISENNSYNAARAAVKIGTISIRETRTLTNGDLNTLISAYQYFYGERTSSLFLQAHMALWDFFQNHGDIKNLLSLFRHSSFIWRLQGNESREQDYVQRITDLSRHLLTSDILTADKDTAYFLTRARDGIQNER